MAEPDAAIVRDGSVVEGDGGTAESVEIVEVDPPAAAQQGDDDEDGFVAEARGGDDCDDEDPSVHPGAPDGGWVFEVVDDVAFWGPNVGEIAMSVDASGRPWLIYAEHLAIWSTGVRTPIRVAVRERGAWTRVDLLTPQREPETYCCGPGPISFTASGDPMLTYSATTDFAEGFAHVLYRQGNEWFDECPLCEQEGLAFVHSSSAIDADGVWRLAVGFEDSWGRDGWLWSGRRVNGAWEIIEVSDHGGGPRLVLDGDGQARVVCARPRDLVEQGEELRYTEELDDGWATELIPVDVFDWRYDFVMDGPTPVVVFKSWDLTAARREGDHWAIEVVHRDVGVTDLDAAVDEEGVQIVFQRYQNVQGKPDYGRDLRLARRRGGAWEEEIVTDAAIAVPRLALGPSRTTYVAYWAMGAEGVDALVLAMRTPDADGIDQDCDGQDR